MPKAFVYVLLITLLLRPCFSSDSAIRPWQIIVGKFIIHLSTSHFFPPLPSPPKDGGFSNRGFGFFSSTKPTKFGALRQIFERCRQKINPSDFIFQKAPTKNWGSGFQSSLVGRGADKERNVPLQLLSTSFLWSMCMTWNVFFLHSNNAIHELPAETEQSFTRPESHSSLCC